MIRILIREVTDSRHRASKSLGLADIEPAADLPLFPGERARLQRAQLPRLATRNPGAVSD
jgi:hypothetical protein